MTMTEIDSKLKKTISIFGISQSIENTRCSQRKRKRFEESVDYANLPSNRQHNITITKKIYMILILYT